MAGKTIKGITIELDGNTSKFQKSLSDANKSIKQTQTALKDVNKALKLDPQSTDLLKQKQELLKRSVDEVSKRLDIEKQGLAELAKADQTPEVTKKMETLERQIAADEAELKNAQKELKEFGSIAKQQAQAAAKEFEQTGKKIQEVGGKISGLGKDITTHVTGPIVAAGTASLAAFNEVDAGYDIVIEKTGAAGAAAQGMYDIVDKLATTIPTDFATAGEAVGEVNTRFGLTGDALYDLSEQFVKFAQLNNTDVTSSIDSVQKALSAYGLDAEHADTLLNRLNKTGQETGVSVDTLTSGLIQNGTAFQEMGLNIYQSTALMGQLEKSGANSETVMQGLRKALKSAAKDGKPLNQALDELQTAIENDEDGMKGLNAAYELFGKSGDQIYGAVKNGTLDFRELGSAMSDAAGSVSSTFEGTLDPIDQWQITLNELKLTGAELGATIGEVLQPILKEMAQVVSDLRAKWQELSPEQQNMIVQIAGIAAVVGPVIAVIGSIVSGIGGLIASIGAVAGVLGVTAATVGGVIVAITAIVAAIVLLITHWDQAKQAVQNAWTAITEYTSQLKENVQAKFEELKQQVAQKIETIRSDMQSKWNQMKSDAVEKVTGMKTDIVNKMAELKSSVTQKMDEIKGKFKEKIDAIKGFFSGIELRFPEIKMPKLPHFRLTGEFSLNPPSVPHLNVDWYGKAMRNAYLLTSPTVMQTPYGMIGAGESGNEIMYGQKALMEDITAAAAANNESLLSGMYEIMTEAFGRANFKVQIGSREFGRILREAGAL